MPDELDPLRRRDVAIFDEMGLCCGRMSNPANLIALQPELLAVDWKPEWRGVVDVPPRDEIEEE